MHENSEHKETLTLSGLGWKRDGGLFYKKFGRTSVVLKLTEDGYTLGTEGGEATVVKTLKEVNEAAEELANA